MMAAILPSFYINYDFYRDSCVYYEKAAQAQSLGNAVRKALATFVLTGLVPRAYSLIKVKEWPSFFFTVIRFW